jgi:hypothetical protein
VPVAHFNVGWGAVVVIVSNTIANSETFEIWLEDIGIISVGNVELVNIVRKVRNVDSGV